MGPSENTRPGASGSKAAAARAIVWERMRHLPEEKTASIAAGRREVGVPALAGLRPADRLKPVLQPTPDALPELTLPATPDLKRSPGHGSDATSPAWRVAMAR